MVKDFCRNCSTCQRTKKQEI